MVLGIYGISENNDRLSASTIREASNIIAELKLLYNTQHVIAAGDYNAVLEPEDSSSQEIRKRTTSAALHSMIDRHHLKVHKNENFFGFDFEFCTISLLVMSKL